MKNNHLLYWLFAALFCLPLFLPAQSQCNTILSAGEDVTLCGPLTPFYLNGSVESPYIDIISEWSPSIYVTHPTYLHTPVNVPQTTTFVLNVRTVEPASNLIVNPDFEEGNTGFTSDYYYSPGDLVNDGTYDVLTNPQSANGDFKDCGDHTFGNGNMLAANMPIPNQTFLWCQTVPVEPHTDYYYSWWGTPINYSNLPKQIVFFINGQNITSLYMPKGAPGCVWKSKNGIWNSGNNTSATLCFQRTVFYFGGIAIDDIFFGPFCEATDSVTIFVKDVKAVVTPSYMLPCNVPELTLSGAGSSVGPEYSYQWETPDGNIVSGENTLYPVIDAPGTYTLTVTLNDAIGNCTKTATATVNAPGELHAWISAPAPMNCNNPNVPLLGSSNQPGSAYQWTAGTGGNIVSGANSAIATVNQPGTYTLMVTNTVTGCTAEVSVSVAPPALPSATIQSPGILGPGADTLMLSATASPLNATVEWTTPDGNIASGANTLHPSVTAPGTYILTVTDMANGCKAVDTVQVAKVSDCPAITVNAGEDIYVCSTPQQVQLNGEIIGDYLDFNWSPADDLSALNVLTPTTTVTSTKYYVLTARILDANTNLIVNGDFEQGNTGFTSTYAYSGSGPLVPGTYSVLPDPEAANPEFSSCNDHSSGSGNMFVVNANPNSIGNVWCQEVPVTPYTDYSISYWATVLMGEPRPISLYIGSWPNPVTIPFTPPDNCEWGTSGAIFNSGNHTSITICFRSHKSHNNSLAFALDDIVMNPVCTAKDTVLIRVINVVAAAPNSYIIPCDQNELTLNGDGSSVGPNIEYNWVTPDGNIVSGQNTLNPVVDAPGSYTLTVNLVGGIGECSDTKTVQVQKAPLIQAWIWAPQSLNCITSTALLFGNTDQPGLSTYQWTASPGGNIVSGANSAIATVNQPGDYTLVVTNTVTGCTAEASVSVAPPALPAANANATPITCAQALATLSGNGSSFGPNYTYAWSTANGNIVSGQDSLNAVADTAGIYVLLVTNTSNGCSKTDTVTVANQIALLPVGIQPADTITCVQNSITLVTDSATAGAHRTYLWTFPAGGNIVSGADSLSPVVNAPGLYILQVTDTLNACKGVDSVIVVADNDAITAIANAPDELTCIVSSVAINANGSSTGNSLTYLWSTSDGNIVSGADSPTPIVNEPGIYQLLLTNPSNGCTATDLAEVTADVAAPDVALNVSGTLNCYNASVNLTNSGTGDPSVLNHQWTLPDGSSISTGSNPVLNTVEGGNYLLVIFNTQNGCTSTAMTTVEQHDNVVAGVTTQQNVSCFSAADGAAGITAAGGDGAYTYLWSDGSNTPAIGNLVAGTYTVTITDGENCTASASATISQPAELLANASATPISVIGASDGTTTANPQGGVAPYSLYWSNGGTTATLTGLTAGFYTVTVTDFNGCTAVQTVQVWDGQCNLLADFQTVNPLCHGTATGQATALPIGGAAPFTYVWTSGSTEQTATGLAAGTHAVTVTDVNDCAVSGEVTLGDPAILTIAIQNVANATCANSPDGSATVTAAGGTGNIDISWSNGQSGPTATNLVAGDYIATATDANGCIAITTATVDAIDLEPPVILASSVTIPLGPSGAMELTLQNLGASVTDNCAVSTVQITPEEFDCFNLGEQQVTIAAQDESGNSSTQTITVTFVDTQAPVLECPAGITRCSDDNTVVYAAPVAIDNCLVLGGTFSLVSGLPSGSPFPQGTTTNTYTYADVSGNMGECSFQVTILSPLVVNLDAVIHDIDNQHIGGIQVTVGGSMPGYTYEWIKDGQVIATTEDLSGIGMGIYTLRVTDASGCKTEAGPYEVTSLVAVNDPEWADLIAIYPNPSSGEVYALLPDELVNEEVDFVVFDGTGRRVLEQQSSLKKQVILNLSGFADGLYSVLIRADEGQRLKKIVISR